VLLHLTWGEGIGCLLVAGNLRDGYHQAFLEIKGLRSKMQGIHNDRLFTRIAQNQSGTRGISRHDGLLGFLTPLVVKALDFTDFRGQHLACFTEEFQARLGFAVA